ncbi:MAG TPA: FISUMP domain-containing protein [Bacteroidales bacterium]|nr:FISUMP domain-containing protein [Bacteroidales bacterium]HRR03941.1 FISUMP domain-containing protein [Bacteroidales bacterium]HRT13450.1 FISUMP domain-containing protein [Bacteroidales bacterium]HXK73282.1 FISUMP domain-containing protein [Bacteroidales bacterium]
MKKGLLFLLFFSIFSLLLAQSPVVLTFTAEKENFEWLRLDSVKIENLDAGWSEMLYYPDTVLVFNSASQINDFVKGERVQVYPNPFSEETTVQVISDMNRNVNLQLFDISGNRVAMWQGNIGAGVYKFKVSVQSSQIYVLHCRLGDRLVTTKLNNLSSGKGVNRIEPIGHVSAFSDNSAMPRMKGVSPYSFIPGENYRFTGFAVQALEVNWLTITQEQFGSETIIFTFPEPLDKSCVGVPTVTDYDGNVYNTVQIGKQCWLRENLKSTHYSDGVPLPLNDTVHDHDIPFYFKYEQSDSIAQIFGMLYTWAAAMRGNVGYPDSVLVQGICPDGWHVPSDAEWCEMEYVLAPNSNCTDQVSYYGNSDSLAKKLCAARLWATDQYSRPVTPGYWSIDSIGCNASRFSMLPAGYYEHGAYFGVNWGTCFWTSTEYDVNDAYRRYIQYNNAGVNRMKKEKCHGFSVRCVKDVYHGK